ncbi:MAG: cation:proton antiporter [Proteobacteria bacterium]|nr:cation:proton antiporter [Pseudomonadota bacterium]MBU1986432.1 cation:proton antiporter [Pseudomonadota bacterium]
MNMAHSLVSTLVIALCLGITAQVVADRIKLPAILPLLIFGMVAGPEILGLFSPGSLGSELEVVVHLGVAVILFEGGLSLDLRQLRQVGAAVRNLLTIGVLVTGVGATILAMGLINMPLPCAALFGALTTVTGPTVITPLLRHLIAPRQVKTVLISEGLIIDPIGAVLAYIVLQGIELAGFPLQEMTLVVIKLLATGGILGFVAGRFVGYLLRSRMLNVDLSNIVVLGILLFCYLFSEHEARHSGILAAIVMGITLSGSQIPDMDSLKNFKGQISTLIISFLFILLAGQLDITSIWQLGWRGLLVTAGLIFLARPLSILLCTRSRDFSLADRVLLMMTAPRGIVAAAMASLAASQLREAAFPGGNVVEGLVYLTILVTCVWATIMAMILPRILGYTKDPARKRLVLIGANALTEALALQTKPHGGTIVVIDSASLRLERFLDLGVQTVRGDARNTATYEQAGVERDTTIIAATTSDELNLLVAELARRDLGVEHPVVVLQRPPKEFGRRSRAWMDLLGGQGLYLERWLRLLDEKKASLLLLPVQQGFPAARLCELEQEHPDSIVILAAWLDQRPCFRIDHRMLNTYKAVTVLVAEGPVLTEFREILAAVDEKSQPMDTDISEVRETRCG